MPTETLSEEMEEVLIRAEERAEIERHDVLNGSADLDRLRMSPSAWEKFDHIGEPLNAYFWCLKRLGDLRGLHVLDAGCGDGWLSVILAKRGATVDAFDVSPNGIRTARDRTKMNNVESQCQFAVGSFYEIPFESQRYDAVIGQAILHHLQNKERAAAELFRVMKPGARAVFAEPLGNSLWLERVRRMVPIASAAPDDPEQWAQQFKHAELAPFAELFDVEAVEFQFLSRLDRVIRAPKFVNAVGRFDRRLLRAIPALRWYARSIALEMRRPVAS
jgi:2-polyprenyl-3-methyl-5-hydroxy-6-metoxy-1,4-benzoquinol methylase